MLDQIIRSEINNLRKKGWSLSEISKELKVPQTTVFRYSKGTSVLPQFRDEWLAKRGGSVTGMLARQKIALEEASELIQSLTKREKLLILSTLYWAEGTKRDFSLTNSDVDMVATFIKLVREIFEVGNDRIRVNIRLYEDLDKTICLNYWANNLEIPLSSIISVQTLEGKKVGKLKYGMCRVRILRGERLLKKIVAVNKVISNLVLNNGLPS